MMKEKTVENHTYHGLGFPIELSQVEMLKINNGRLLAVKSQICPSTESLLRFSIIRSA
jgi:hypothetical protein